MIQSYSYRLTTGGTELAAGTVEIDSVNPNTSIEELRAFTDVLIDLAQKSGYAIEHSGLWCHPTNSNFIPFEDEHVIVDGAVCYGISNYMPNKVKVRLIRISGTHAV